MRPATCVGVLPCNPVSGLQDRPLGVEGPAHRKARSDVTSGLLRSMGRAYTLLTHRHPYDGNPANPYIKELQFILSVVRNKWHQYNMTMRVAGEQPSNAERQKWGLSHQLLFDFECMIEGFIELLADLKSRYKKSCRSSTQDQPGACQPRIAFAPPPPHVSPSVSAAPLIVLTTCAQDLLESLFDSLRYSVGGGSALSHYKVETGIGRVQEQRDVQKKMRRSARNGRGTPKTLMLTRAS